MIEKCRGIESSKNWSNFRRSFKRCRAQILAKPVGTLCNLSMKWESFPDACKLPKVKWLFKKDSKTGSSTYRPISLLPLWSKVFERVILDKILFDFQSGVMKNIQYIHIFLFRMKKIWKALDDVLLTSLVLIDLQKHLIRLTMT